MPNTANNSLGLEKFQSPLGITQKDINELNVDKLQEVMLKSIYMLEAALFSQAATEHERIASLRDKLNTIEEDLHNSKDLTDNQKIRFHETMTFAMRSSMGFMVKLHSSVADGLESISSLKTLPRTS